MANLPIKMSLCYCEDCRAILVFLQMYDWSQPVWNDVLLQSAAASTNIIMSHYLEYWLRVYVFIDGLCVSSWPFMTSIKNYLEFKYLFLSCFPSVKVSLWPELLLTCVHHIVPSSSLVIMCMKSWTVSSCNIWGYTNMTVGVLF